MVIKVVLAGLLATALLGGTVALDEVANTDAVREPRSYTVRATLESRRVVEDSGFVEVDGRVFPPTVGERVILQQRLVGSGRWKTTDQGATRKGGRFWLSDLPRTPGVRYYRVVKPPSGGLGGGTSASLEVTVLDYDWTSLVGRHVVRENLSTQPVDVAGSRLDGRLTLVDPGQAAFVEYNLDGRCELLDVGAGMTATSDPGSEGWVTLNRDGVEEQSSTYYSEDAAGGASLSLDVDVAHTRRLRLDFRGTQTPPGYPSVFKLRAFCRA